ncbi:MAG TPA: ECF-type sigma factor [Candidatus Eisenbacteria bacterium]
MSDEWATETLIRATNGSREDAERLFQHVYGELREMAAREMRRESPDHTLQPTELVHEVFFRLVVRDRIRADDRREFLGMACRAMRQVLVDHARRRSRIKRGGGQRPVPIDGLPIPASRDDDTTILALNEALERLMQRHPEKARLVDVHYFAGFTLHESAEILGLSARTAARHWAFAQAWLVRELSRA